MSWAIPRLRALSFRVIEYRHPYSPLLNMPPRAKRSYASATKSQTSPRTSSTNSPSADSRGAKSQPSKPAGRTPATRRSSSRLSSTVPPIEDVEHCPGVIDGADALRASPDADNADRFTPPVADMETEADVRTPPGEQEEPAPKRRKKAPLVEQVEPQGEPQDAVDKAVIAAPDLVGEDGASPEELKDALGRPPPVNSGYLPLPWKGRLGYVSYIPRSLEKAGFLTNSSIRPA